MARLKVNALGGDSKSVLVMDVRIVWMRMSLRRMDVFVRMWAPRINPCRVLVLVVVIVIMAMFVFEERMLVFVAVALRQMQPQSDRHESNSRNE